MRHAYDTVKDVSAQRWRRATSKNDLSLNCATELSKHLDRFTSCTRRFSAGSDLFNLGERCDAIYRLTDGWVALYGLLEDGRQQILHFALPGAVLAFAPGRVMIYSAQALTEVTVGLVPYENLYTLFAEHSEVGMQLAWLIGRDRGLAYDHLLSLGRCKARERVAHLLLELFIRCRMRWPSPQIEDMYLPLTQEHIGDATGLTNVHVNRVLHNLRDEGILEFHHRRLRILNPDKLVDAAQIDSQVAMLWLREDLPDAARTNSAYDKDAVFNKSSVLSSTGTQHHPPKHPKELVHV